MVQIPGPRGVGVTYIEVHEYATWGPRPVPIPPVPLQTATAASIVSFVKMIQAGRPTN